MLGFTLPLLCFGALEGIVALILLLPIPFCRPGILFCKLTNTHAGRTCIICIAAFLSLMLLAPIYDMAVLHKYKVNIGGRPVLEPSSFRVFQAQLASGVG